MKYLYLDSSSDLEFGLFDDQDQKWIFYKRLSGVQNSKVLHAEIFQSLAEIKLKFSQLDAIVINSGPGSYTGMRLTEGFAQILEWQKTKVYSFYHFDVPAMLGIRDYTWVSTAFKGEWFIYSSEKQSKELIREESLKQFLNSTQNVYTHFDSKQFGLIETSKMIYEQFQKILSHIQKMNTREDVYYFRKAEDEFKLAPGLTTGSES